METLKPIVSKEEAKLLIDEHYGIKVTDIQELNGYDDCNFYCKVDDEKGLVEMNFKVTNHVDTAEHDLLESLNEVALFLFENGINLPVPIKNLKGNYLERIILSQSKTDPISNEKRKHAIRLYTFIPGIIFQKVDYTIGLLGKLSISNYHIIIIQLCHITFIKLSHLNLSYLLNHSRKLW